MLLTVSRICASHASRSAWCSLAAQVGGRWGRTASTMWLATSGEETDRRSMRSSGLRTLTFEAKAVDARPAPGAALGGVGSTIPSGPRTQYQTSLNCESPQSNALYFKVGGPSRYV